MGPVLPVPAWAKGRPRTVGTGGRAEPRSTRESCALPGPQGRARASPGRTGDTGSVQVAGCGGGACSLLGDPGRRGPSLCWPPGRLLLGGNQVDARSAAGHLRMWLPPPESSPLTLSTNIYLHLQRPRESAPPPWGPDGSREWSSAPEREAGVRGGNRCAPSAPRAAPRQARSLSLARLDVTSGSLAHSLQMVSALARALGAWPVLVFRGGTRGPGHQDWDTELCGRRSGAAPPSGLP